MTAVSSHTLAGLLIFAGSVWVGGLVAIAVVARVATRTLEPAARVAFFRGLGRAYGVVGSAALALAYGAGAALLHDRSWGPTTTATTAVAVALAATLAVGVAQARRMTRLRRSWLASPDDAGLADLVRRGAARAGALRGVIALLSLVLMGLGVALGS